MSCVWGVVIVSRYNPLLLPRIAPLSQSGMLVHQSVLFSGQASFFFFPLWACCWLLSSGCRLQHLRCCPLFGFVLRRYLGMGVRGKWSWQADLSGWLTAGLTFSSNEFTRKSLFSGSFAWISVSFSLFFPFSWYLRYHTAFQLRKALWMCQVAHNQSEWTL